MNCNVFFRCSDTLYSKMFPRNFIDKFLETYTAWQKRTISRKGFCGWDTWISSPRLTKRKFELVLHNTNILHQLSRCHKCLKHILSLCRYPLFSPPCLSHLSRCYKTPLTPRPSPWWKRVEEEVAAVWKNGYEWRRGNLCGKHSLTKGSISRGLFCEVKIFVVNQLLMSMFRLITSRPWFWQANLLLFTGLLKCNRLNQQDRACKIELADLGLNILRAKLVLPPALVQWSSWVFTTQQIIAHHSYAFLLSWRKKESLSRVSGVAACPPKNQKERKKEMGRTQERTMCESVGYEEG